MKPLFVRDSGAAYLLSALFTASVVLAFVEANSGLLAPVRAWLGVAATPVFVTAGLPHGISDYVARLLAGGERVAALERQVLELSLVVQEARAERAENTRLRRLLGSRPRGATRVLVAELLAVAADRHQHRVVIDKGRADGVATSAPVLDVAGLFGQVVEASAFTSVVLLITDRSHATPVEVERNGLRSIAAGSGRFDLLELEAVPQSADIAEGDLLVTSGLGGRFPAGHSVGLVEEVEKRSTARFARVTVRPMVAPDRSRHVLVLLDAAEDAAGEATRADSGAAVDTLGVGVARRPG